MIPRPYQADAFTALRTSFRTGHKRPLLVAPTGAGKNLIARLAIEAAVANGTRVVFVAPRKELVEQTSRTLDHAGINHGIMQGAHWRFRPSLPVQVATTATLMRRQVREPGLLFIDEAHVFFDAATALRGRFPGAHMIGMTATPVRLDGRGLGEIFDDLLVVAEMGELIGEGYLTGYQIFAPPWQADTSGVKMTAGDYNRRDLARAVDRPSLTGDVVQTWLQKAERRPTLVFATGVEHSQHLANAFCAAGVRAVHVDAETAMEERTEAIRGLTEGRLEVVCNVELFTYGVDVPRVSCISVARPTQSLALHLQMLGRGLRPYPLKEYLLVLDHAGNTYRHGLPAEPREWSLDGVVKQSGEAAPGVRTCPMCFACCPSGTLVCPACGEPFPKKSRDGIVVKKGELSAVGEGWAARTPPDRKVELYAKWCKLAREHSYKPGYASAVFRATFGVFPDEAVKARAREMVAPVAATA
jgi:DNA repair protein RadD